MNMIGWITRVEVSLVAKLLMESPVSYQPEMLALVIRHIRNIKIHISPLHAD